LTNITLYDSDYHLWIQENIRALENHDLSKVDIPNLLKEFRKLENAEVRELKKLLLHLMANLLSWSIDFNYRNNFWAELIIELRQDINDILNVSPSFKKELSNFCKEIYPRSVLMAADKSQLNKSSFPDSLQMSLSEILEADFNQD
jgi:hypothetical protein